MAAEHSPEGHALLSPAAQELDPAVLDAYAEAVERELGLRGKRFSGENASTAVLAVVYGVNCALTISTTTGRSLQSESKGSQSRTYASGGVDVKGASSWCELARKLAGQLLGWNKLVSLR